MVMMGDEKRGGERDIGTGWLLGRDDKEAENKR